MRQLSFFHNQIELKLESKRKRKSSKIYNGTEISTVEAITDRSVEKKEWRRKVRRKEDAHKNKKKRKKRSELSRNVRESDIKEKKFTS